MKSLDAKCEEVGLTNALKADGFDSAIMGFTTAFHERLVYDAEKIIKILMKRDNMTREEAEEYFSFNIEGAYVGENTPIFLHKF